MNDEELRETLTSLASALGGTPVPVPEIQRRARRHLRRRALGATAAAVALGGAAAGIVAALPLAATGMPAGHRNASGPASARVSPNPSASAAGTAVASARRCTAAQMDESAPASKAYSTMPGIAAEILLRNAGRQACYLEGWPAVTISGASGAPMGVQVTYGLVNGIWQVPVTRVTLRPGQSAGVSLLIGQPSTAQGCHQQWALTVTLPGEHRATRIREPGGPFLQACPGYSVEVSPFRPGNIPPGGTYTATPAPGAPTAGIFTSPPLPQ